MAVMDVERFRTMLLEERKRVADAIQYLHDEHPGSLEDETAELNAGVDQHLADMATETVDREIDYTLEENSEHVLAAIDEALGRIENNTFGTCVNCGAQIPEERLEARPWAPLCIDCKRKEERG